MEIQTSNSPRYFVHAVLVSGGQGSDAHGTDYFSLDFNIADPRHYKKIAAVLFAQAGGYFYEISSSLVL